MNISEIKEKVAKASTKEQGALIAFAAVEALVIAGLASQGAQAASYRT